MNDLVKNLLLWVVVAVVLMVVFQSFSPKSAATQPLTYDQFVQEVQGDRVSGAKKPATLETGAVVQVPLFINVGDKVKVDTRSGDYISKA